ncbi:MAG: TerB family tellurite resistance protein [Pseudomonadota bacterium]
MSLVDFSHLLKIFGGHTATPEEKETLFKESLLLTLSRATSADTNIDPAEVDTVKAVIERITGDSVDPADIRVAAASALYESAPLNDYLKKAGRSLEIEQRVAIVTALADIIRSDSDIRGAEVDFFNSVYDALNVTPAQLAGLMPNKP